jgi:hypothetical protein
VNDDFSKKVFEFNQRVAAIAMIRQVALNTIINSFDESSYVDLIVDGKTMEQVHWLGDSAYIDVWQRLRN